MKLSWRELNWDELYFEDGRFGRNFAMIRALYTAASGMQAQQLNLDNIANNLANVRSF